MRRLGQDFVPMGVRLEILRAGLERHLHQRVFIRRLARDDHLPFAMKQPADGTRSGDAAAAFGDEAADFRCGAIAVVRAQFDQQRDAVRTVNLVGQILVLDCFRAAGALFDRPLDVVVRHVCRAAFQQHHAQAGVHARITAGEPGGNGDFLAQLGKNPGALGVNGAFEMLYLRPLAVTGHCF